MITGIAFVPEAPALVPELGRGLDAELGPLRAACGEAVRAVVGEDTRTLVVGSGTTSTFHARFSRGSLAGFGLAVEAQLGGASCGGGVPLGPAVLVGAWSLHGFGRRHVPAWGFTVGPDWAQSAARQEFTAFVDGGDVALVVAGDGSACRTEKSPGFLDDRAVGFDVGVATALAAGDPAALLALDAGLGAELAVAGVPAWHAVAQAATGAPWTAELRYDDAPFGVGYFVASWICA